MDYKTKKTNDLVSINKISDDVLILSQKTFDKFSGEETETVFSQLDLNKLLEEKAELEALLKDKNDLIADIQKLKSPTPKVVDTDK